MPTNAADLNDRHLGEDIFIVGAGPQLNRLSREEQHFLNNSVSIGLNRTQYFFSPSYFLSAYLSECLLALLRGNSGVVLHARPKYENPLDPRLLTVRRRPLTEVHALPRTLTPDCPTLYTLKNAAIMATHLAFILGAKRIFYLGVEQNNSVHFYQDDLKFAETILSDVDELHAQGLWQCPDHKYTTYESVRRSIYRDRMELSAEPFYKDDHAGTFRLIFDQIESAGTQVFSTSSDSVIVRAGARICTIASLVAGESGERT